ncbi:hypothetical protein WBJ53_32095 (plasmid) [Spirosoma sp. SC4-14]|uniref:hypothetical protein n=1 Tax=Spirosoma sp. SC4-14 TaxID=3128900 RepID=UPI0030CB7A37
MEPPLSVNKIKDLLITGQERQIRVRAKATLTGQDVVHLVAKPLQCPLAFAPGAIQGATGPLDLPGKGAQSIRVQFIFLNTGGQPVPKRWGDGPGLGMFRGQDDTPARINGQALGV